jgi:hypothetical protein
LSYGGIRQTFIFSREGNAVSVIVIPKTLWDEIPDFNGNEPSGVAWVVRVELRMFPGVK